MSRRIRQIQWYDQYTDYLVEERRRRNEEYHSMYGRSRMEFWNSVARRFIYNNYILRNGIYNSTNLFVKIG
jgi:hypothetical protein